jgi:hypothetical protein
MKERENNYKELLNLEIKNKSMIESAAIDGAEAVLEYLIEKLERFKKEDIFDQKTLVGYLDNLRYKSRIFAK